MKEYKLGAVGWALVLQHLTEEWDIPSQLENYVSVSSFEFWKVVSWIIAMTIKRLLGLSNRNKNIIWLIKLKLDYLNTFTCSLKLKLDYNSLGPGGQSDVTLVWNEPKLKNFDSRTLNRNFLSCNYFRLEYHQTMCDVSIYKPKLDGNIVCKCYLISPVNTSQHYIPQTRFGLERTNFETLF